MATSGLPTGQLGKDGPRVTKLGFGAMGLSGMLDPRSHFTLDPSSFGTSCYASQNLRDHLAQPCYMAIKSPMSSASKCWTSCTSSVVASSIHRTRTAITRSCLASGLDEVGSEMRWVQTVQRRLLSDNLPSLLSMQPHTIPRCLLFDMASSSSAATTACGRLCPLLFTHPS